MKFEGWSKERVERFAWIVMRQRDEQAEEASRLRMELKRYQREAERAVQE